jgi:hypothetical protein
MAVGVAHNEVAHPGWTRGNWAQDVRPRLRVLGEDRIGIFDVDIGRLLGWRVISGPTHEQQGLDLSIGEGGQVFI